MSITNLITADEAYSLTKSINQTIFDIDTKITFSAIRGNRELHFNVIRDYHVKRCVQSLRERGFKVSIEKPDTSWYAKKLVIKW